MQFEVFLQQIIENTTMPHRQLTLDEVRECSK